MPSMNRPTHYAPYGLNNYVDLADWQDDKRILRNPHKGWYVHYVDNGFSAPIYRDSIEPGDFLEDFPGLNHMYLRFDWVDIEPEEGVYRWELLDEIIEKWGAHGYRFSLRPCTFEGDRPNCVHSTPDWVYGAGAGYQTVGTSREPNYDDPVYLDKLETFMGKLGERYANHPLLEFVDVGTYGTWGEGHTVCGTNRVFSLETMRRHIDLHVKNFPNKFILLNDDYVNCRNEPARGENLHILEYARQLGLGLRDDSICVDGYAFQFGYDTLRTPMMYDLFWKDAPVDLEYAHMWHYMNPAYTPSIFKDGYPALAALQRAHATYAGFHGVPREFLKLFPSHAEYVANRLGYWFFVGGLEVPVLLAGARNFVRVVFENRGFAPCYHAFKVRLKMVSEDGAYAVSWEQDIDPRKWLPGDVAIERCEVDLAGFRPGRYELRLGIFEGDQPIEMGMDFSLLRDDGFYRMADVTVI